MEGFLQCLSYMAANEKEKDWVETLLPYAFSLLGVVIGFSLNLLRDKSKSKKENANKVMCIEEDVHRLRQAAQHLFTEINEHIDLLYKGGIPTSHRMGTSILVPSIDKYFIEVAHLFTQEQRHNIVSMLPNLESINKILEVLSVPVDLKDTRQAKLNFLNAGSDSIFIIERCNVFFDGTPEYHECWVSVAETLGIKSDFITNLILKGTPNPTGV